jgi:hypothetical protein
MKHTTKSVLEKVLKEVLAPNSFISASMPYTQEHKCVIKICQKLRRTAILEGKKGVILYFFAKNIFITSQGFMYRGGYSI